MWFEVQDLILPSGKLIVISTTSPFDGVITRASSNQFIAVSTDQQVMTFMADELVCSLSYSIIELLLKSMSNIVS